MNILLFHVDLKFIQMDYYISVLPETCSYDSDNFTTDIANPTK